MSKAPNKTREPLKCLRISYTTPHTKNTNKEKVILPPLRMEGLPLMTMLLPSGLSGPYDVEHLSPISAPEESNQAVPCGSVAISFCSCEVESIVLSPSALWLGLVGVPQMSTSGIEA